MSTIYFLSDTHFGHSNILKYCPDRPWKTIEEMNAGLVERWNSVVKSEDLVYFLGDFSLGKNWIREITPQLKGRLSLVAGNHDFCHPIHYKFKEEKKLKHQKVYIESGFLSVHTELEIEIVGQKVLLCHLPYKGTGDHTERERYSEIRPIDGGKILLHGHTHSKEKISYTNKGTLMIHVGCDAWNYFPIPISEIEELILEAK